MSALALRKPSATAVGRWLILGLAALYFFGPLLAAIIFTVEKPGGGVTLSAYGQIFSTPSVGSTDFTQALTFSLGLSAAVIVVVLVLMVPTQVLLHLYVPRMKPLVEIICLLPLVFPPVVLVVGVSDIYRSAQPAGASSGGALFHFLNWIRDSGHPLLLVALYTVMALPFAYRTLNAGIESIDLRTLVEASRNLGAGWLTTIMTVVSPALRTSMINTGFLCFALAMGEYTVASILLYTQPFPVWLAQLPTDSGQVQAAISVFSLLLIEVALLVVSGVGLRKKKGAS